MHRILIAVPVLLALTSTVRAGWEEGWSAYSRRDYAVATREFIALAEQGDVRAQLTLRIMRRFEEEPEDLDEISAKYKKQMSDPDTPAYREALNWIGNAADKGDVRAWTLLGNIYESGYGVPRDPDKAMKLFLMAAEQGEVTAQKILTSILAFQNEMHEASGWARKAAEQGDRWGQAMYGHWVEHAESDKVQAYMWYTLAAAQGSKEAIVDRDLLAKKMTPAQVAAAERAVQDWKPKDR